MFIGRKEAFEREVLKIVKNNFDGDRVCEVCGCLIKTTEAVKGVSVIKIDYNYGSWEYQPDTNKFKYMKEREYLFTPYYCKVHAPKKEEKIPEQPPIPNESKTTEHVMWKVQDYSKRFRSCGGQWGWHREECGYCIHYDATEFEKYKENLAKGIEDNCQYITRCRYKRVGYWVKEDDNG